MSRWAKDDDNYPQERGVCDVCQCFNQLKLALDKTRFICLNESSCIARWKKQLAVK